MNPRKLIPTQEPGVLDFAPGAAAAFSLRNLSYTYAGPVVTVRRGTDNAEADFTATEVSDGTLAAWCGGGDGYVKQWWSQTGSNHAIQGTAAYQPQIVDSGVLVTEGGKAAVRFDGSDDRIVMQSAVQACSTFFAMDNESGGTVGFLCDTSQSGFMSDSATNFRYRADGNNYDNTVASGHMIVSAVIDPATLTLSVYANGAKSPESPATVSSIVSLSYIGYRTFPAWPFLGTISEIILYPTDQTALRTRIEGNLAWYY